MARKKLGELLIEAGVIDGLQLQSALGEQRKWGRPLGITMVQMGLLSEETLVATLSAQLNIPAVDILAIEISAEALFKLDLDFCLQNSCIPFAYEEKGSFLDVAMADPTNPALYDMIRVRTRCNLRPHLAGPRAIELATRHAYLGETISSEVSLDNRPWVSRPNEVVFEMPEELGAPRPKPASSPPSAAPSALEGPNALERELKRLRAELQRDERVLRKIMALLVEKHVCTREELLAKINED